MIHNLLHTKIALAKTIKHELAKNLIVVLFSSVFLITFANTFLTTNGSFSPFIRYLAIYSKHTLWSDIGCISTLARHSWKWILSCLFNLRSLRWRTLFGLHLILALFEWILSYSTCVLVHNWNGKLNLQYCPPASLFFVQKQYPELRLVYLCTRFDKSVVLSSNSDWHKSGNFFLQGYIFGLIQLPFSGTSKFIAMNITAYMTFRFLTLWNYVSKFIC